MAGKVGCGLTLAVLFAIAAISRAPFAVLLLALGLVGTAFLVWDARTLRRDVQAGLQLPTKPVRPGEEFAAVVQLHNTGRRPIPELRVAVQAADAESGTAVVLPCGAMLAAGQRAELRITLRAAKSGLWRFRLQRVTVRDHLGVFTADCPLPDTAWELCVLPPAEGEDDGAGHDPQNKAERETTARGQDMAEGVYDLRPYRAGDSLKQIHWKLTAKLDELTVRAPLGTVYSADPTGAVLAEGGDAPRTAFHFGQAAVTRLRTLTRRKAADPDTGLVFVDRRLLPLTRAAVRPALCAAVDYAILLLLTLGLLAAVGGAFALTLPWWLWLGAAALCAFWLAVGAAPLGTAARRGLALALTVGYLVLLFVQQGGFLAGAAQFGGAVAASLNARFGASLAVNAAGGGSVGTFLLLALVPITAFLAAVTVWHADTLLLGLVLLPTAVFLLLAGQSVAAIGWLALLLGCVGARAAARPVRRKRLWGEMNSAAYAANVQTFLQVQKAAAAGMLLASAVLLLPAWVLCPVLTLPLNALQPVSDTVQSAVVSAAVQWLPQISGGALNFHVSAAAGGVEEGSLSAGDGLSLTGLEDLAVTTSEKPDETVYLRGFIGETYDGTNWQAPDAEAFDAAAANWKTDGDSRLAIANLPFLRAAYGGAEPQMLTVQRIHANDAYTYAPYNAYLNDWYALAGDGAAAGQTAQDDTFYYFPRKTAQTLLAARADADVSVLDALESAYAGYVKLHDLAVPEGDGYAALKDELDTAVKERKLKTGDTDGLKNFVRSWLNERCTYSDDAPQPPDGSDPVLYFLTESCSGGSTQFASAAVVLCRMAGLPARYVVGYAAPQTVFAAQTDGTYRAVLRDDSAHAWAEIYVDGQGWTPLEVTPGVLSELEENTLDAATAAALENPDAAAEDTPPEAQAAPQVETPAQSKTHGLLWLLPAALLLAALAVVPVRRARRTPEQRVRDAFRALYRKMRRCGLPEGVSSDEEAFADFLVAHCGAGERQTVETLLALVQAVEFSGRGCTAETAQKVQGYCATLRKKVKRKKLKKP